MSNEQQWTKDYKPIMTGHWPLILITENKKGPRLLLAQTRSLMALARLTAKSIYEFKIESKNFILSKLVPRRSYLDAQLRPRQDLNLHLLVSRTSALSN